MESLQKAKRRRVPNFTTYEKTILAHLVKEKKDIIESKLTDSKSVQNKKLAWEAITQEFNANGDVQKRDTITLKKAWDNLKAMTRKFRVSVKNTSIDGSFEVPPDQLAVMDIVEQVCPSLQCEIKNSYDSDANFNTSGNDTQTSEFSHVLCISPEIIINDNKDIHDEDTTHAPQKRVNDVVRREALIRVKAVAARSKKEQEILQLQLKAQENRTRREEIMLETAQIEQNRAQIQLQAAQLEMEFQRRKLHQSFPV